MSAAVKIEHLSYIYSEGMPDASVALDDVSFEIEAVSYTHLDVYKRQEMAFT